jgi:hypothetical protein
MTLQRAKYDESLLSSLESRGSWPDVRSAQRQSNDERFAQNGTLPATPNRFSDSEREFLSVPLRGKEKCS